MSATETYFYHANYYTWNHEPQNLYRSRHISIRLSVIAINNGILSEVQEVDEEERLKYIGHRNAGIITVITDVKSTRIITAWHSSKDEVKLRLKEQG